MATNRTAKRPTTTTTTTTTTTATTIAATAAAVPVEGTDRAVVISTRTPTGTTPTGIGIVFGSASIADVVNLYSSMHLVVQ